LFCRGSAIWHGEEYPASLAHFAGIDAQQSFEERAARSEIWTGKKGGPSLFHLSSVT
jgi:hypothetical protein